MKSHEFSQVIIYKVKTALKEMIPRNIIQCVQSGSINWLLDRIDIKTASPKDFVSNTK
jgi:hypothetical protein